MDASADHHVVLEGIRHLVRELRVSSRASEREHGLSGAQLFVLQQLARSPVESLNELAERTLTHQSSVSVVVSRLVAAGLVSRDASIDDGRRVTIALTPSGRAIARRAPEAAQGRLIAGLRQLSQRELGGLARGIGALVQGMDGNQSENGRHARAHDGTRARPRLGGRGRVTS
ncbi:MAG: MarR family transcriptional regulator [Gemmatimonadaceae bacterium]